MSGESSQDVISRFAANFAALFASQILNTVIASVFSVVFIRHFGREEYGIFRASSLLGRSRPADAGVRDLARIVLRHYTGRAWN